MARQATLAALAFLLYGSATVGAQQNVRIEFKDGLVWLAAQNATVGAILREWARVGDATVVNGDAIGGGPITIELQGATERDALAIVLRDVPGYLIGAREPASTGSSVLGRVFILPTADSRNAIGMSQVGVADTRAAKTPEENAAENDAENDATRPDQEDFPGVLGEIVQLTGFTPSTRK